MNILMLGAGKGSLEVRGKQLGAKLGARVALAPSVLDLQWADVVVLIKRADPAWAELAHAADKPVVWDALDFWQQPDHNALAEVDARALLRQQIAIYQPELVIGATQAMSDAANGVYLPHHARPRLTPGPVRQHVTTVAYEGTKKFLGRWKGAVRAACQERGWRFVVNPADLREADIIVALRDGLWDGWMCREWKSGVKVVNAIAAGRPLITQPCAAVRELVPSCSIVHSPSEIGAAFDLWADRTIRAGVVKESSARWATWSLPAVADRYRDILQRVVKGQRVAA